MATDLTRGAYSGKETFLYYNTGTHETPEWTLMTRVRNISVNDGPALSDVEFHSAAETSQIPGYKAFNGSFEYVQKRGTDTLWAYIRATADAGGITEFLLINDELDVDGAEGWRCPVIFGELAVTANGGDPVVTTVPFGKADAYDASDVAVEKVLVTMSSGVPTPI